MALWYVDNTASGSNNGTSWTNAWQTAGAITGLTPGDTVYISGGTSGQTYSWPVDWSPTDGTAGNPITFAVGQDTGHTGMVTFTRSGSSVRNSFLFAHTTYYVTINGEVSGQRRMTIDSTYAYVFINDISVDDKHLRFLYLEWNGPGVWANGAYYEIAYCYGISSAVTDGLDDSFINHIGDGVGASSGYGLSSIHHNYFQVARLQTSGLGYDLFKYTANTDIYNNICISAYQATYNGGQHNDGYQGNGSYVRIFNNYFENFISFPIYYEILANTSNVLIYNNVMKAKESGVDWGAYIGVVVRSGSGPFTIDNIIVSNNTLVGNQDAPAGRTLGIHFNNGAKTHTATNCYVVNNLFYGNLETVASAGAVTVSNNVLNDASVSFVSNDVYPTGNFRLLIGATAAIDQGISPSYLTSIYTTDADGFLRNVGAWDLGAYEFGTGVPVSTLAILRRFL